MNMSDYTFFIMYKSSTDQSELEIRSHLTCFDYEVDESTRASSKAFDNYKSAAAHAKHLAEKHGKVFVDEEEGTGLLD